MAEIIINLSSSIFDMFIILIYFSNILMKRRDSINRIIFYSGFVIMEIIIFVSMILFNGIHTNMRFLATVAISLVTSYLLTLFYEAPIRHRIFVALSFQVFCNLSEMLSFLGYDLFRDLMGKPPVQDDYVINFLSKIITLILVFVTILILKGRRSNYSIQYSILVLLTPVVSIITIAAISYPDEMTARASVMRLISIIGLMFLNIANYILLDNVLLSKELKSREQRLMQQNKFQSDKYDMISAAYRDTRRLIHDTRKHYFFIRSAVEESKYDIIPNYINKELNELENKHIPVNSGNLVIDSFVSNYIQLARQEGTRFDTKIRVIPDLIPVKDYDLCVIIGNLLENSLEANRKITDLTKRDIMFEAYTSEKEFVVHVSNAVNQKPDEYVKINERNRLEHGYGIENIDKMVLQYQGVFTNGIEGNRYSSIIVIPIFK